MGKSVQSRQIMFEKSNTSNHIVELNSLANLELPENTSTHAMGKATSATADIGPKRTCTLRDHTWVSDSVKHRRKALLYAKPEVLKKQ
jgi:hypothetical protein